MNVRATLKDVAREAEVSVTTAAAVLRGESTLRRLAPRTQERVREAAQRLQYQPDSLARSLRTGRRNLIGIITGKYLPLNRALRIDAAAQALIEAGYQVMLQNYSWRANGAGLEASLEEMRAARVDGIIVEQVGSLIEPLARLAREELPIVALDPIDGLDVDCVMVDRERTGYLAATHLLALGHRRIGFLVNPEHRAFTSRDRVQGYRRAHSEWGVPVDEWLLTLGPHNRPNYEIGYEAMARLLAGEAPPTAVMAIDDHCALGAFRAIFEAGLNVPKDIAVVGATGFPEAAYYPVPLTTAAYPFEAMAKEAVRMLLERIAGNGASAPRTVLFPPELVIRDSCGAHQGS